jgi:hypothetical protein
VDLLPAQQVTPGRWGYPKRGFCAANPETRRDSRCRTQHWRSAARRWSPQHLARGVWSSRGRQTRPIGERNGQVGTPSFAVYALLDGAKVISTPHMLAALAAWDYSEASAEFIFGDSLGYPEADRILAALRDNPQGLNRTEIRDLFGRNQHEPVIQAALTALEEYGLAQRQLLQTGGRPAERWVVGVPATTKTT